MVKESTPKLEKGYLNKSFDEFDQLNLKTFADHLMQHSIAEYPYAEGSLAISLNGRFGTGKSYFLEMMKSYLESNNYNVIHINAWKNDFFNEPIVTIASEIIDYVNNQSNINKKVTKSLKKSLLMVIDSFGLTTNQVINKFTGIDIQQTSEIVDKNAQDSNLGTKIFKEYIEKSNLFIQLNDSLNEYVDSLEGKPLFILVDELDRSRPNFAVHFLETLKHFFQTQGIIFILGVDKDHLESSVRSLYGDLDFSEYYRKFIHRDVNLPKPEENVSKEYIAKKVEEHFIQRGREKFYTNQIDEMEQKYISDLCYHFNLSLRQINEFFRILSHTLITRQGNTKARGVLYTSIIYIVIKLNNEQNARKIRDGHFLYQDYIDLFNQYGLLPKEKNLSFYDYCWALDLLYINANLQNWEKNQEYFVNYFYSNIEDKDKTKLFSNINQGRSSFLGYYGRIPENNLIGKISEKIDMCLNFFS